MDKSWIPTAAGILDVVSGVAALLGCMVLFFIAFLVGNLPPEDDFPFFIIQTLFGSLGVFLLVLSVLAIVGGVSLLQRRSWGWAIVAAIAAALICPPLGVPGIILTVLAEPELQRAGGAPRNREDLAAGA